MCVTACRSHLQRFTTHASRLLRKAHLCGDRGPGERVAFFLCVAVLPKDNRDTQDEPRETECPCVPREEEVLVHAVVVAAAAAAIVTRRQDSVSLRVSNKSR